MNAEEQDRIEAACIRLQRRYGTLADRQDPAFRELFTHDAVIELPGYPPFAGIDAIMAGQMQWKASGIVMRHVCTNFTIEMVDETRAKGLCYVMVFRHEPLANPTAEAQPSLPLSLGEFHDGFVKQDGRWLFRRRKLVPVFRGIAS